MEFGFLTQGWLPEDLRKDDPNAEHQVLMDDLELCIAAEKAGFKYAWVSEHHFLDEYSHISSSDVFISAVLQSTSKIHVGSGIFNPLPKVHHPAALAERVTMLDHLSNGRFEFGTGRGAGSHEITAFHTELADTSSTREIWEETVPEFAKMWLNDVYPGFEGKHWSMPARKVLPKPYGPLHPAMWYAAGNLSSFEMAGRKGLGAIGFSLDELARTEVAIKSYKEAVKNPDDQVGAFVNDNIIVANGISYLSEDREEARRNFVDSDTNYYLSQVYRYHDTFPRPEGVPAWPGVLPKLDEAALDAYIGLGSAIVGDPDDAIEQVGRWEATGADQILFTRANKTKEETLRLIELMGRYVIPKFDKDPVHRTTRHRQEAAAVKTA
ncbi:MAG: LLM class flavin-dependent oxidoreductase [Hyphomicrobiales bacterium]|nr:MAG: LLM class flavin-dependent oxidoreductase [Hyphomicrobiales bacterium]